MKSVLKLSLKSLALILIVISKHNIANAGIFGPSNFAECILGELRDAKNDVIARELTVKCLNEFPDGFEGITPRLSIFDAEKTWQECVLENTRGTSSEFAATRIRYVCVKVYPVKNTK